MLSVESASAIAQFRFSLARDSITAAGAYTALQCTARRKQRVHRARPMPDTAGDGLDVPPGGGGEAGAGRGGAKWRALSGRIYSHPGGIVRSLGGRAGALVGAGGQATASRPGATPSMRAR